MSSHPDHSGSRTLHVLGDPITPLDRAEDGTWSLFEMRTEGPNGPPLHRHDWDESYYVLEGRIGVQIGADRRWLKTGDYLRIPRNVAHTFAAPAGESARFLIFTAPVGAEAFFAAMDHEVPEMPPPMEKVVSVATRMGVEPLGPPLNG